MDYAAGMGCTDICCGKQGGHTGVETGKGVEPVRGGADVVCLCILVHEPCRVAFPGLFDRGIVRPGGHVCHTPERVVGDDRLDDRVEGRYIRNRACEFADRSLCLRALNKVCHVVFPPCCCLFFFCCRGAL